MNIITTTLTITMALVLNMQECHCDGICGVGKHGELGPFQIHSFTQMAKLGCVDTNWLDFDAAMPCVQKFLWWLEDTIPCNDVRFTYAAYNWGIGNVLNSVRKYGCKLGKLPKRAMDYANLTRGWKCWSMQHSTPFKIDARIAGKYVED